MTPDREEVIKELESLRDICNAKSNMATGNGKVAWAGYANAADDALALLKKQEPVMLKNQHKPYGISTNANSPWISRCPKCGKKIEGKQTKFCKYCGQAVKWE